LQEKRDAQNNLIEPAESIVDPHAFLAASDQQARLLLSAKVPQEIRDDPQKFDRVVVAVNPF